MATPHTTAQQLEWVGAEYMLRWLGRCGDSTVTAFGEARAVLTPDHANADFLNTVHRLLPDDDDQVPRIAAHYREAGVRPWFELMPAPGFDRLAGALAGVGGRHIGFLTMSERELPAPPPAPLPGGVAVYSVAAGSPDVDTFARVLPVGHDVPDEHREGAIVRTRENAGVEGARLYLATVDGVPAAAAVLLVAGNVGYLANASTLPGYRRRGCQGALIQRRLADAAAASCERASILTVWDSQSHANAVRAGFRPAYTKAVWRVGEPDAAS